MCGCRSVNMFGYFPKTKRGILCSIYIYAPYYSFETLVTQVVFDKGKGFWLHGAILPITYFSINIFHKVGKHKPQTKFLTISPHFVTAPCMAL